MKKQNEAELTRELLKRINDVCNRHLIEKYATENYTNECVVVDGIIYTAKEYEKILMKK